MGRYIAAFVLSVAVSTFLIRKMLPLLDQSEQSETIPGEEKISLRSVGFWIGFFETLLIFMFVAQDEFGALAIVMAAKEFVRKEKVAQNPAYYSLYGGSVTAAVQMPGQPDVVTLTGPGAPQAGRSPHARDRPG